MTSESEAADHWHLADREPLAAGREAEVFALPGGQVLKLMREPGYAERAAVEAAASRALRAAGVPATVVLDVVEVEGRAGLVLERIDGTDLLTRLTRRPWTIVRAGRVLGEVHARLHGPAAPDDLPDVRDGLRERIEEAPPLPQPIRRLALDVLGSLPSGDRLCHGDLHLANVLGSFGEPVVIDWGYASRGPGEADVARTLLLHTIGQPPDGLPAVLRPFERWGRARIVVSYLRAYRAAHDLDDDQLARWRFVHAAARLNEPIPVEHPFLLTLLEGEAPGLS